MGMNRCLWCIEDPFYMEYHDKQWGVPVTDDQGLFEMIVLEGAQAGLSWLTVLKKRDNYRKAFEDFDIEKVALFNRDDVIRLCGDTGIIRNRVKIDSAVRNARAVLDIWEKGKTFAEFLWRFVDFEPIENNWTVEDMIPVKTPESEAMSIALKEQGFFFVGPTICYAFMQSVGMVNDHVIGCFRHGEINSIAENFNFSE
ncbi:MAG: DNA-3-methyladenine glycosylase I [Deltaproteobacteria bacterium]|nr:DNA-3-methyladenine glycosylase I [Deltaproteobacteria bacterium]